MKKMLPFLLALIVAPAWAADEMPFPEAGVTIELKGESAKLSAVLGEIEKETVYKEAGCATKPAKKAAKKASISCTKADGALLTLLSKNAQTVRWSISGAAYRAAAPMACPTGCVFMNCPPPAGPVRCCNTATHTPC